MLNNINDLLLVAGQQEGGYEPYHEVLEYIKTDGTQYFNPDLLTNADYTIEARFKLTDTSSSSSVFGGRNSSANPMNGNQLHYIYTNGKTQYIGGYSNPELAVENAITVNDVCEVVCDNTGFSIAKNGGTPTKYSRAFATIQYTTDLMLCATYTKTGDAIQWGFRGELYTFKIRLNGELIRDYVPALDNKMQPCLYDKISKTFTYAKKISDGTTTYDLGFKRWNKYDVDYISFTGTQYIDLGLTASYTSLDKAPVCEFEGKIDTLPSSPTTMQRFVSAGVSETNGKYYQIFINWKASGTPKIPIGFQCGTATPYMEAREADTEWHYYKYDIPNKEAFIDDTLYDMTSYTSDSISIPYNIYIGARNLSGVADRFLIGSLKYLKWSVGGQLIRDFKPSVRTYNNGTAVVTKAFLYDEVYNKAYDNAGTGSFKAYIIGYGNVFTRTGETTGKFIDANGNIQTNTNSAYSDLLPIKGGETVTCKSGTASGNNYRYHVYDSSGNWIEQGLVLNPPSAEAITGSFVAPSNASYVRVSYANANTSDNIQVNSSLAIFEVGKSVSGTPTTTGGVSNCFDTGLYGTQDTTVKYIAIAYDSTTSSGQLFGSYDGTTSTSQNLTINSTGSGNTAPIRFDGQSITTPIKIPLNGFASIVDNKYGLWVNDTLHGSWGDVNDFTTLTTLLILKCNNSVNVRNNGCCYCLLLEKDVPVAEYIPVRNANNTSVYGLYDRVNKELNTGEGTINFNVLN